ncbi:phage head closure protein [Rhodoplanes roseus]|uniref:Head-tail adaptor protein n=1 Tax=Rhodoplanes roseus TaxID=29409 RepID=A0A327L1X7_9BRAD|nr:phage head closure protein [Rhodoplanes roseus]RAI43985.1 head-tail adaptor protein [Rhodoplanes roseus]
MKAGTLDRTITVEGVTTAPSSTGAVAETWSTFATLRAQMVQASTEEFQRAYGASTETAIVFRTRYVEGVTLAHRVVYGGEVHNMKEIKEIGRRRGLELRCERVGV